MVLSLFVSVISPAN